MNFWICGKRRGCDGTGNPISLAAGDFRQLLNYLLELI